MEESIIDGSIINDIEKGDLDESMDVNQSMDFDGAADLLTLIKESFALKEVDIRTYSPLTLAYIGDAVYDLIFRTVVVQKGNTSVNRLHHQTVQYVRAPAQAVLADVILEELSSDELAIYKRGRNAKPCTMAKNATTDEYKKATGLEALVGYLYLTGQMERALFLIQIGLKKK